MDELRISTPPRAARAKKRSHLPREKKEQGRVAKFFSQLFSSKKDSIKQEAKLKSGDEDEDEDEEGSEIGPAAAEIEVEQATQRPSLLARLKARMSSYTSGKPQEEVAWDGIGEPPWVERGSSVGWSEDKSRIQSEYGDNFFDYIANPKRLMSEPPVFFDPVEDRVRSRWLPVFGLCCLPAVLATVLLLDVWDKSSIFKLDERPVLNTLFRSGDVMLLNMPPASNMSLKVQALNRNGWPLQGIAIKAHVIDHQLSPASIRSLPVCSRPHGVSGQQDVRDVCRYSLSGEEAVTNRDGVATFSQLAFQAGLPGVYKLEFYASKSLLNVSEWLTVKASVSQVRVDESYAAERAGGQDIVFSGSGGFPLKLVSTPPAVRIVLAAGVEGFNADASTRGAGGLVLANLTVFAVHLDASYDLGGELGRGERVSSNPELANIPNSHVELVGAEAKVDSNGVARFSALGVAGYDRPYLMLAFVCQGQVLVWSQVSPPAAYNMSEYAAARGGHGALPTVAYIDLPGPTAAQLVLARAAAPTDSVSTSGSWAVNEGVLFGLQVKHNMELAGSSFVAKLKALGESGVDPVFTDYSVQDGGEKLLVPTYHKILVGNPVPVIPLEASGVGKGIFRTSLFGRPGKYVFQLYFMGVVVSEYALTVIDAVDMLTPGELPDSPVICGVTMSPVCRHASGECSFGPVAGSLPRPLPTGFLCDGIHVLTNYTDAGDGILPWAMLDGQASSASADGSWVELLQTSYKLISLEFVPWGSEVKGFEPLPQPTPAPVSNTTLMSTTPAPGARRLLTRPALSEYSADNLLDWDVVTMSRAEQLTGRYGSAKIASLQVLVVAPGITHLQPVFRVDKRLFPLPIKVPVTSLVAKGFTNCGLRACTYIKVEVGLPGEVTAGQVVAPAPRARVVDGEGLPVANSLVCLVHGSAHEVERLTSTVTSTSEMWSQSSRNFLCQTQGGAAPASLQCSQLPAALAVMQCASTDAAGVATLNGVTLRSHAALAEHLSVWRFLAVNAFPAQQVACLNTYSCWVPTCRSVPGSVLVVNPIQRIEAKSGFGAVAGIVLGQRSLQATANGAIDGNVTGTTVTIPLACYGNATAGAVACANVQATLVRLWNSRSHLPVAISAQTFVTGSEGGGNLTLTLQTRLAGIYLLALESHGAKDQLFLRLRHDVAELKQVWDRKNTRAQGGKANYTWCQYDCAARNVSNIGREHVQDIRANLTDATGAPIYGAQVWVELVSTSAGLGGQLSGSVSAEQEHMEDWLPDNDEIKVSTVCAVMPDLAVSAALPGTYQFRLGVFNPAPIDGTAQLPALLTHEFYVKDTVTLAFAKHPPVRVAGGVTGPVVDGAAGSEMELSRVSLEVVRWQGHTSFMFADKWVPPVLRVEMAGVAVSAAGGGVNGAGEVEHVNVSRQGLDFGVFRASLRQRSRVSGLLTESSEVPIAGRVRPLSSGRYCVAVGGVGISRSKLSADDSNTLWLPEATTGSIHVPVVSYSVHPGLGPDDGGGPSVCSRAFAVSDKAYGLAILSQYPTRIGQGEEVYVDVRATLGTGEPLEGIAVEAEVADVSCTSVVAQPIADTVSPTGTLQHGNAGVCDAAGGEALDFKGVSGVVNVLNRKQVTVNTMWTTRVKMLTETGHAMTGSVGVTDANGVATVPMLLSRAKAGQYRLRFRAGAIVTHPTDVIHVSSIAKGIRIIEPLVGKSEKTWVGKQPLGPYDFSAGAQGGSVLVDGVYKITGDLSSDQTLSKADVQVVDSDGNALKRGRELTVHLVTCGRRWMPNGSISFPPAPDSDCEEFLDFDVDGNAAWVCRTKGKCDQGFTRYPTLRFWDSAKSGFYYVFFASDGFVTEQPDLFYVSNIKLPADASVLSYRLFILIGLAGLPLVFNANLVNRARIWLQLCLGLLAFFVLACVLYVQATIASYGSVRNVQPELVLCGILMTSTVGSVGLVLVRLVFQPDSMQYFTARQAKYLRAMRDLLVKPKDVRTQAADKQDSAAPNNRIHPEKGGGRVYKSVAATSSVEKDGVGMGASSEADHGSNEQLVAAGTNFGAKVAPGGATGFAQRKASGTRQRAMLSGDFLGRGSTRTGDDRVYPFSEPPATPAEVGGEEGHDIGCGSSTRQHGESRNARRALLEAALREHIGGEAFGGMFKKGADTTPPLPTAADGHAVVADQATAEAGGAKKPGRRGKGAMKISGGDAARAAATAGTVEPQDKDDGTDGGTQMRRRNVAGKRATARMGSVLFGGGSSAASRKKAGRWWARAWNLPSLRSVLLLQSKEGRQQIADYWDVVLTDLINLLTGAKAQAGEAGQVQEGFQYPMRLLAGLALSLTGLLVMLVGFDSAYRRTRFGLERLRAEVVRYRVSLGNFDSSVDLPVERMGLPSPPYSDTYDIVALTYTIIESLYGRDPGVFESLLDSMQYGNQAGTLAVIVAYCISTIQTFRKYRQMMLALRADRSLIDAWKYPIHEAAGYPGRQLWASLASGLLVWLPTTFIVALFLWPPSSRLLMVWVLLPVGGLLTVELASFVIRRIFNKLTTHGPYIKNRTLFGVYDFIGLYMHFVTGSALAVSRMVLTYVDFATSFSRLDLPVVEGVRQHWDAGHASFMAMLYLDFFYNAPITSTLAYNLAAAMYHRREMKEVADADISRKGHLSREKSRVAMVQRNRWHFLFTMARNGATLYQLRVHPPAPPNTWDVDDDVLDVESVQEDDDDEIKIDSDDN